MSVPIATRLHNLFTQADRCGDLAAENRRLVALNDELAAENEKYRQELLAQARKIARLEREGYGR